MKKSIDFDDRSTRERLARYGFDSNTRDFGDFMRKMEGEFGSGNANNMLQGNQGVFPHEALVNIFKTDFAEKSLKENFKADLPMNLGVDKKEELVQERYDALMSELDGGYAKTKFAKDKETKQYQIQVFEPPKQIIKVKGYSVERNGIISYRNHYTKSYSRWNPSSKRYIQSLKSRGYRIKEVTKIYNQSRFGTDNRHTDKSIKTAFYRL